MWYFRQVLKNHHGVALILSLSLEMIMRYDWDYYIGVLRHNVGTVSGVDGEEKLVLLNAKSWKQVMDIFID